MMNSVITSSPILLLSKVDMRKVSPDIEFLSFQSVCIYNPSRNSIPREFSNWMIARNLAVHCVTLVILCIFKR